MRWFSKLMFAAGAVAAVDAVLKSATPESLGFTKADYDRIVAIK